MSDKPSVRRRTPSDDPAPQAEVPVEAAPAPAPAPTTPPPRKGGRRRGGFRAVDPVAKADAPAPGSSSEPPPMSALEALAKGSFDMGALLGADAGRVAIPEPGTRVTGVVSSVSPTDVHLDIGGRAAGWIARRDLGEVAVGDTIEGFVLSSDDQGVVVSTKLTGPAAAAYLEEAAELGLPVEGKVESRHAGGYAVRIGPIRAFCPMSQISRLPLSDPDAVLGQTLSFKVLDGGDDVVVSRRQLEEADLETSRAARWPTLTPGTIVEAIVTGVQAWGAFLDIDGIEMRLPAREATWEEVSDLTTRLDRGQIMKVRVVDVDAASGRVTVSAKDPSLDPWNTVGTTLSVGSVITGTVVSQVDFGAFVSVAPGLQGLVHSSVAGKLPSPGEAVEVRVLSIDADRRRIELAPSSFDPEAQAANVVGTEVRGEVIEVSDRGVGVRLEDGRRAWLPGSEVPLDAGTVLAQRFRVGHPLTARIAREHHGKVTLSQKVADEGADWRKAMSGSGGQAGMGTLGDLLGGWKKG